MNNQAQILIVEDEALVAEDIKAHVQDMGFGVSNIIANGEEAIDYLQTSQPEWVSADFNYWATLSCQSAFAGMQGQLVKFITDSQHFSSIGCTVPTTSATWSRVKRRFGEGDGGSP